MAVSVKAIFCGASLKKVCSAASRRGLVGGEGFAIDASLIKADANRQKGIEGEKGVADREARQAELFKSIWLGLTMQLSELRTEVVPKFHPRRPIRRHAGLERRAGRRSLLTPPTI